MTRLKVSLGGATCNGLKLVTSLTKEIKKSCENKIWHILQSNPIDLSRIEGGDLQGGIYATTTIINFEGFRQSGTSLYI